MRALRLLLVLAAVSAVAGSAIAQTPTRPIEVVVQAVEAPRDRLAPGASESAMARFGVVIPGPSVCTGAIEVAYKAAPAPGFEEFASVSVEPATQRVAWGAPVEDLAISTGPHVLYGLATEVTVELAEKVPAFLDIRVLVAATARPVDAMPGCTLSPSAPAMAEFGVRADYVAGVELSAHARPYQDDGLHVVVSNTGNGPSRVLVDWATPAGPRLATAEFYIESLVAQGTNARWQEELVLPWDHSPPDWTGDVIVTIRSDMVGTDLARAVAVATFDASQRPLTDGGETQQELDPAELPAAGLLGALGALVVAARGRRR